MFVCLFVCPAKFQNLQTRLQFSSKRQGVTTTVIKCFINGLFWLYMLHSVELSLHFVLEIIFNPSNNQINYKLAIQIFIKSFKWLTNRFRTVLWKCLSLENSSSTCHSGELLWRWYLLLCTVLGWVQALLHYCKPLQTFFRRMGHFLSRTLHSIFFSAFSPSGLGAWCWQPL